MSRFYRNRRHSAGSLGATMLFATFALLAEGADMSPGRPFNPPDIPSEPTETTTKPHHVAGAYYPDEHPQAGHAPATASMSIKTVLVVGFGGLAAASFAGSIAFFLLGLGGKSETTYHSSQGGIEI